MNFYIMTLFPEMVMDGLNTSIIGRAVNKGLLSIEALNIRDYAFNKHHSVDDYPYGGGAGMLMQAEPVYQCYDALARQITERKAKATEEKLASGEKKEMSGEQKRTRVIYLSPQGKTFNQSMAEEFAQEEDLVFLCGHYEGIELGVTDQNARQTFSTLPAGVSTKNNGKAHPQDKSVYARKDKSVYAIKP